MWTTSSRDNWERLVAAVIKRQQIWQLCHQDSISTVNSDFSEPNLSFSSNSLRPAVSSSPSPRLPLTNDLVVEVRKNVSGTITRKLFSTLLWRKKAKEYLVGIPDDHFIIKSFPLRELQVATNNFKHENIIGMGAHCKIYKGRLPNGSLVAVKRFTAKAQVMLSTELETSSIVSHPNVLRLRGFCTTATELIHVYPYMANGSVESCLRRSSKSRDSRRPPLDWAIRQWIALGVARGLAYLHHECIRGVIHGNVHSSNILVDKNFGVFVAGFTFAKFMDCYDDDDDDDVIRGRNGYIAPEYISTGKCSLKADVFYYGFFLLELITGQRTDRLANDNHMMLLDWVKILSKEKNFEMVDEDLEGQFVEEEMEKLLRIALICTQTDPDGRPMMSEVVRMLEDGDVLCERWEEFSTLKNSEWIL